MVPMREVRLSAGAEFVVVICGDIMTMPGLPKVPAANNISALCPRNHEIWYSGRRGRYTETYAREPNKLRPPFSRSGGDE